MCITNKHNHLWPCLWIFLFIFQIYVHKTVISLKKQRVSASGCPEWSSLPLELGNGTYLYLNSHIQNFQISVISLNNTLRLCGVYNIYEDLIDTAKTTKIIYNTESGKVKFDSSRGACRGQLFKFNERIANT